MFIETNEEAIISEIRNYTSTGYHSDLFNSWVKKTPYYPEMARLEVEEYPPEHAILSCVACRTYLASLLRDRRN